MEIIMKGHVNRWHKIDPKEELSRAWIVRLLPATEELAEYSRRVRTQGTYIAL